MDTQKISQLMNNYKKNIEEHKNIIYKIFFYGSIVFLIVMICYWAITTSKLNKQSPSLNSITNYSLKSLSSNDHIKEVLPFWKSIDDLLNYDKQLVTTIEQHKQRREELSLPFDKFLSLYYVPSLNIWRDPFRQTIDTTLIGKKYLEHNPYGDIALMERWTDFFKDVGIADSFNTINNINIGTIEPLKDQPGYFSLNIKVDFESPDKRSFLLLVNKISMTAYLENISLINEFLFYVWDNIKKDKADIITQQQEALKEQLPYVTADTDQLIGYLLYEWVSGTGSNILVSQDIITKAIRQTAGCLDEDQKKCNYIFRQKTRNIPYLAYGIGKDNTDQVAGFKTLFHYLPPILSIEEFNFEELSKTRLVTTQGYRGSITIKVYGKDILNDEINAIANELWLMCFISKESLQAETAIARIEKHINDLWVQTFDTRKSTMLNQILLFATAIQGEYEGLPNYKKIVRLFELYRTLKENNLCDTIDHSKDTSIDPLLWAWSTDETTTELDTSSEKTELPVHDEPLIDDFPTDDTSHSHTEPTSDTTESEPSASPLPEDRLTIPSDRQIWDGKSQRDQQLTNELEQ